MKISALYLIGLDINRDYLIQVAHNYVAEKYDIGPSIIIHGRGRQWRRPLAVAAFEDGSLGVLFSEPLHLHTDGQSNCRGHIQAGTIDQWNNLGELGWVDVEDDVAELAHLRARAARDGAHIETVDQHFAEALYNRRDPSPSARKEK